MTVRVVPAEAVARPYLEQRSANPVLDSARFEFGCPSAERVSLKIYDSSGREVVTLLEGIMGAGNHAVEWNAKTASGQPAASGIYFCRLVTKGFSQTRKMVVIH